MNDKQAAIEIINNCRCAMVMNGAPFVKLDEADIDKLYAALRSKPSDVEGLRKTPRTKHNNPYEKSIKYVNGWNDCLQHLQEKGYMNTPPQSPDKVCLSKNTDSDRQTTLSDTDERQSAGE